MGSAKMRMYLSRHNYKKSQLRGLASYSGLFNFYNIYWN